MIYSSVEELIGNTPLVRLTEIEKAYNLEATLLAKVEFFNPAGSVKDRVALQMVNEAEKKGILAPGSTIIEPTSGNTGIGLACIGAKRGYKVILTMPESMSIERRKLIGAYGARIVLTPADKGMQGAVEEAERIAMVTPGSFIAGQFYNPANPMAHYLTTGPEIWNDTNGKIDIFVAGAGTGGTVSGTGKYLKEKNENVKIVAVEPLSSPLLTEGKAGPHGIQGIGANFVPENLNREIIDEIIPVSDKGAKTLGAALARKEGLLVGISSGAAVYAAVELAKRPENKGKTIVALLPDTGERYISSDMFD